MLKITAAFTCQKNYYDTVCIVFDMDIDDAFKVAPPTTPATIGWNA